MSPRLKSGIGLALVLILAAAANTGPIASNDYGLHLRIGEEIAESGPPSRDHHSHTLPNAVYRDHEWISQFTFFQIHRLVGDGGMVALRGLLIGLALLLVGLCVRGPLALRLLVICVVFLLGLDHSHMRPHLIAWVLAAGLALMLNRGARWSVLPLFLVWGNCHGSVLLGVGIAGLHFLREYREHRNYQSLIAMAACALIPLANPNGIHIYTIFFEISGHTGFIGEWKAYGADTLAFWLILGLSVLSVIGWLKSRPLDLFDAARVVVLVILAFLSSRNGVVSAIYLAPLLGRWYEKGVSAKSLRLQKVLGGLATIGVAAGLVVRTNDGTALRFRLDHLHLPVAAVEFIQKHSLQGPLYNDYNFGGYLLWKAWPEHKVFIDGRTEVYKGRMLKTYLKASRAEPGWDLIARRYGITFFLVRPERPISQALVQHPGWQLVYFDYNSAIYVRSDRFPNLKRLQNISPYGHRNRSRMKEATAEIRYLLSENPRFFGGYKILAFLLYRQGDARGAAGALQRYLSLRPQGRDLTDTQSLIEKLEQANAWR